jgi:hemerythrin-like domain-containing protein
MRTVPLSVLPEIPMNPTQLITHDHENLERLFKRLERTLSNTDGREASAALREVTRELSVHGAIEEQFLYPALRNTNQDETLDCVEEHHAVKLTLAELEATPPADERFAAKARLLIANVREHIAEEERELLPALEDALEPEQQRELGAALANAKLLSPTRPHPSAPEMPPGNLLVGPALGVLDRLRDAVREGAFGVRGYVESAFEAAVILLRRISTQAQRRGREAVGDLAARTRVAADEVRDAGRRTADGGGGGRPQRRGCATAPRTRAAGGAHGPCCAARRNPARVTRRVAGEPARRVSPRWSAQVCGEFPRSLPACRIGIEAAVDQRGETTRYCDATLADPHVRPMGLRVPRSFFGRMCAP